MRYLLELVWIIGILILMGELQAQFNGFGPRGVDWRSFPFK